MLTCSLALHKLVFQLDAGIAENDIVLSDEEPEPEWTAEDAAKAESDLLNQQSRFGYTPIMWAAKNGHLDLVNFMLERGAETTPVNNNKETALTLAINKRFTDVGMALIEGGCDKDHLNSNGWSPLMIAAGNGDLKTVSSLVKRLCSVNYFTQKNATALVVAKSRGNDAIAQVLIDGGALEDIEQIKENFRADEEARKQQRLNKDSRPSTSEERRRNQAKLSVL